MRRTIFIVFISLILVSCGSSYSVPRATLHVDITDENQFNILRSSLNKFLVQKGFTDLVKDEKMLELLEWRSKEHQGDAVSNTNSFIIDWIHRTRRSTNDELDLYVEIVDYSDFAIKKRFVNYPTSETEISNSPSLELNIYNSRPGGFSAEGHEFYKAIFSFIELNHNQPINIVFSPPETDQYEFYKNNFINFLAIAFWWLIVYMFSIAIFAVIVTKILERTKLTVITKRGIFVFFGTLLVTPLPFPAGIILSIMLPSILALPLIEADYVLRIQDYAIPSFIVSAIFCALLSIKLFKEKNSENT